MTDDCIFCAIIAEEIPGHVVYEDDETFAFLDANPLARGHTLVVPREHHDHVQDMPAETAEAVFATMHRLVPAIEEAVGADATTVGFNNGSAAGQEVGHVHGHVVPRFEGDGAGPIHALFAGQKTLDDDELANVAEEIENATS